MMRTMGKVSKPQMGFPQRRGRDPVFSRRLRVFIENLSIAYLLSIRNALDANRSTNGVRPLVRPKAKTLLLPSANARSLSLLYSATVATKSPLDLAGCCQ